MKRFILLLTVLFLASATAVFAQKKLPNFTFTDLQGKAFSSANLTKGVPTIVFFYDPYCDHCAQQAEWIKESAAAFKNTNLVWVSTEESAPIQEFKQKHFADAKLNNLFFLRDTQFMFDGYFGYSEAPSIYVYNKENVLTKSFKKETYAIDLLKAVAQ